MCAGTALAGPAAVAVGDAIVTVTNRANTTLNFTVTRSGERADSILVPYATSNGSALAGSDYLARAGILVISPDSTSSTLSVPIIGRAAPLADKTFSLLLGSAGGGGPTTSFASPFNPVLGNQSFSQFVEGDFNGDG